MKLLATVLFSVFLAITAPVHAASVNVNTADAETLQQVLTGVGSARARAIIEYREKHGPFKSVDEIGDVEGIGEATLDRNRDRIQLN